MSDMMVIVMYLWFLFFWRYVPLKPNTDKAHVGNIILYTIRYKWVGLRQCISVSKYDKHLMGR